MASELERAIGQLVEEYERLHTCEISSIWIEHYTTPPAVKITVTTHPPQVPA